MCRNRHHLFLQTTKTFLHCRKVRQNEIKTATTTTKIEIKTLWFVGICVENIPKNSYIESKWTKICFIKNSSSLIW